MRVAAYEVLGLISQRTKQNEPYWWDKQIEKEIKEKREKYHTFLNTKRYIDKMAYKEAQVRVRQMITQKKNENWEKKYMHISTYLGGRKSTEIWRVIKLLRTEKNETYKANNATEMRRVFQGTAYRKQVGI